MDLYKFLEQRQNIFGHNLPPLTTSSYNAPIKQPEEVETIKKKPIMQSNDYEYDEELTEVENIRNEAVADDKLTMKKMRDYTKQMLEVES